MLFPLWLLGKGRTVAVPPVPSFLLQEDSFLILQEDSDRIIIESSPPLSDFLTQEDGFLIKQENFFNIII